MMTTIEQHKGQHPTGMRMVGLLEVRTTRSDYVDDETYREMDLEDREALDEQIAELHALKVRLQSLDADQREAAIAAISERTNDGSDLDGEISLLRDVLGSVAVVRVEATAARPTQFTDQDGAPLAGFVDVDVDVRLGDKRIEDSITLAPREDGGPGLASWGDCSGTWIGGALDDAIAAFAPERGSTYGNRRAILDMLIEAGNTAARKAGLA